MAEEGTYPMDIDQTNSFSSNPDKGKTVISAPNPSIGGKSTLWVEKYRPQSLDDVAAHRDIVDTSNSLSLSLSLLGFIVPLLPHWRVINCLFISVCVVDRLTTENRLPHLLLYGPPGTGKTSTILAVARKLYGAQYHNMILELNASDDRGIDVVRQQIQDFASTQSLSFGLSSLPNLFVFLCDCNTQCFVSLNCFCGCQSDIL